MICSQLGEDEEQEDAPRNDGTIVSSFVIEGKKGDFDCNKLKYQLFANTIIATVANFVGHLSTVKLQLKK